MKIPRTALAAFLYALSAPAAAVPLPAPEEIAQVAERPLLPRVALGFTQAPADSIKNLDALLAELKQPTELRGLVQYLRAYALDDLSQRAEAKAAVAESVRLLPAYSAPLLLAAYIHMYNDEAAPAADFLLRGSQIDNDISHLWGDYQIGGLLRRLGEIDDNRRRAAVSERLMNIGWSKGKPDTMNSMAVHVLESRLARGDIPGASAMIPKIISPFSFARLLRENRFAPLWPAVEAWAGSRLEKQWPIYLQQARAEWEASNDLEAGRAYASALSSAGHYNTVVATFLPLFDRPIDPVKDDALIFVARTIAYSLTRLNRWEEADALLAKASGIWLTSETANALNINAYRASLLWVRGELQRSLTMLDQALADTKKWGTEVNYGAIAAMHHYRACALAGLGRETHDKTSEFVVEARRAVTPVAYADVQLCQDDLLSAKKTLVDALANEATRPDVIAFMQPTDDEGYGGSFAKSMAQRRTQLRQDEALLAAVLKHGRIQKQAVNAGAPSEQIPTVP